MVELSKWRITALVAVGLTLMAGSTFALLGFTEEAVRSMVRTTARSSVILFVLAFCASSLQSLFQSAWSSWLLRNRRYIGVSFALSHGVHLLFLLVLAAYFPHPFLDQLEAPVLMVLGLAYVFIAAMTVTSFRKPRQWLGQRGWNILHTTGSYYIWFIFMQSYVPLAMQNTYYAPFALIVLLALVLRIARAIKRRNVRLGSGSVGT